MDDKSPPNMTFNVYIKLTTLHGVQQGTGIEVTTSVRIWALQEVEHKMCIYKIPYI